MLITLAFIAFIAMIASWLAIPEKSKTVITPSMAPASAAVAAD